MIFYFASQVASVIQGFAKMEILFSDLSRELQNEIIHVLDTRINAKATPHTLSSVVHS